MLAALTASTCRRRPQARGDRERAGAGRRRGARAPAPPARVRRAHRAGRFRHRLLVLSYLRRFPSTRSRSTAPSSATSPTGRGRDRARGGGHRRAPGHGYRARAWRPGSSSTSCVGRAARRCRASSSAGRCRRSGASVHAGLGRCPGGARAAARTGGSSQLRLTLGWRSWASLRRPRGSGLIRSFRGLHPGVARRLRIVPRRAGSARQTRDQRVEHGPSPPCR